MEIILASNSPRRKELLSQAGIEYKVVAADIDEVTDKTIPAEIVQDLSRQKAAAVADKLGNEKIILAADTVVAIGDKILGKPKSKDDALDMLTMLSGRTHQVFTGVTLIDTQGGYHTFSACTDVTMYDNSKEEILDYISTGEPMDKAGAYGIQGRGAILVKEIKGDYNNVVGMPLAATVRLLKTLT